MEGKVNIDERNDRCNIYLDKMSKVDDYIRQEEAQSIPAKVVARVSFNDFDEFKNRYETLYSVLVGNTGHDYVEVIVNKEHKSKVLKEIPVDLSNNLINSLIDNFGIANVKFLLKDELSTNEK